MEDDDSREDKMDMTDAQWEAWQAYTNGYGEQDENGIDISLLRENLKLTPTERLERLRRDLLFLKGTTHVRRS